MEEMRLVTRPWKTARISIARERQCWRTCPGKGTALTEMGMSRVRPKVGQLSPRAVCTEQRRQSPGPGCEPMNAGFKFLLLGVMLPKKDCVLDWTRICDF